MMVLWLLMLRAIGIEFRIHIDDAVWRDSSTSSFGAPAFCCIFYGAALGNVIRGVPLKPKTATSSSLFGQISS